MTDEQQPRDSIPARILSWIEWLGNALPHPATLFAIFALLLVLLSWLLGELGLSAINPVEVPLQAGQHIRAVIAWTGCPQPGTAANSAHADIDLHLNYYCCVKKVGQF